MQTWRLKNDVSQNMEPYILLWSLKICHMSNIPGSCPQSERLHYEVALWNLKINSM